MKQILAIVHQSHSNPGLIGHVLETQGYTIDTRCPAIGELLPETLEDYAGAIVFGGPMSANDDNSLPFIRVELDWIETALASGKPYLGVCLGAQMLARVLGAKVTPHPEGLREIGYVPIQPTLNGEPNPLAGLKHVYHWHKEGFEIPLGASLLATGNVFTNQAFRYGEAAYGIQFHPEITHEMIDFWTTNGADQLVFPGAQSREAQMAQHSQHGAAVKNWLTQFLQTWLSLK